MTEQKKAQQEQQQSYLSKLKQFVPFIGGQKEQQYGRLDMKDNDNDEESQSLITNVKQGIFTKTQNIKESVTQKIDTGSNYKLFAIFFIVGLLFLFLSLTFLPLILVAPNKFNLFFGLGSLFIQISLAFYHGPLAYMKIILKKENIMISLMYVGSVLLAIYSSLIWGTYISAMLVVFLQVFSLGWFVIQAFQGGQNASQKLQTMVVGGLVSKVLSSIRLRPQQQDKGLFDF
ncbi:phosphatidylinositol-4-phosphate 5-kinase family protein [Stylonychia lemnae]|uniref:Vesicle transport protein n=1 Tax=Stylonychia lemnae TaxID=5949 RepID=A0A078AI40_STYLE|nr:phosphatidylinositol-4-phosphate 5-kinase family protein [Stylonychia lemnae]|eukprot:CDW80468.1 phosphatidylinositol-4-phosphate 5-kinase family protein [Stylonychia lemnae]